MPLYDSIGCNYRSTRQADPRIVSAVVRLLALPPGATIADIGAGTGNYARALAGRGYRVQAIEPSAVMRAQAAAHPGVQLVAGSAEALPLADSSADGVIALLSFHHYADPALALREMTRVAGAGPILLFTVDPRAGERFWLADYFPSIWSDALAILPPVEELAEHTAAITGRQVVTEPFPLPHDLQDLFMGAAWRRPEQYMDTAVRANISAFAVANLDEVQAGIVRLADDLETGEWKRRYGDVLMKEEMDLGYRFLLARPAAD